MYKTYRNTLSDRGNGSFSVEDIRHGMIALHTDYQCPRCGRNQSVARMGGYGGDCVQCGLSSNPEKAARAAGGDDE
jgi:ribosomal protein L37AE/L43A